MIKNLCLAALLLVGINSISQENTKSLSLQSAVLSYYNGLYPRSLSNLKWTQDNLISYRNDSTIFFQHPKKNNPKTITIAELNKIDSNIKRIPYFSSLSENECYYRSGNNYCSMALITKKKTAFSIPLNGVNADVSPNKKAIAYTIENNLFVANSEDSSTPITNIKNPEIISGQAIHRFEFGITKGTFWSPNSTKLAFYQKDESQVASYPLLDINDTPGKLNAIKYPMAGQKSEKPQIGIYNVDKKTLVYLKIGADYNDNYLTNLTWGPDSKYIYVAQLNRGQNHMELTKYNSENGDKEAVLFEEKHQKWVEPENGLFFSPNDPNKFLWLSERDGFMNIYLYDTSGKMIEKITSNTWVAQSILGIDKNNTVFYSGTGDDPRNLHLFSISLNNKKAKQITQGDGIHNCQLSPNKCYLIDNHSTINEGPKVNIIDLKKNTSKTLHQTANPLTTYQQASTELITIKANDGTPLHGRIIKPNELKENKKYPVLVYVYGGPHAQMINNGWLAGGSLWMHWMATQKDYIIFTLDNRGSSNRGFEFESIIHRNLGTVEMEDQLTGINYLKTLNYIDTNRLAVHGWSFGGFMTSSLMLRSPGVFNCGVAGGPVTDWKWYEVMYGERYMDLPEENKEGYKTASLLNYTNQLQGKLLLIHGTSDDVVVMQHNLALVQQFVRDGIQVDFFPYPMHPHNVRGRDRVHLMTKILNYVMEHN